MVEHCILVILILASIADFKKREVPVYCQIMLCCLVPLAFRVQNLLNIFIVLPFIFAGGKKGRMGMGDIKLVAILGLLLGINKMFFAVVFGLAAFILFVSRMRGKGEKLFPFVPALLIGYIITMTLEVFL